MMITDDQLQLKRHFRASRAKVFEAWTSPEILKKWFSGDNSLNGVVALEADIRPGGTFRVTMNCSGGIHIAYGTYREITPIDRVSFTHQWESRERVETLVTIELTDKDGGTDLVLTQTGFTDPEETKGHSVGWTNALDNLEQLVSI